MTNYRQMKAKLQNTEPFTGNSVTAKVMDNGAYEVWSYETLIFVKFADESLWLNNKYFSKTTSKLQNMIIDIFHMNGGKRERGFNIITE